MRSLSYDLTQRVTTAESVTGNAMVTNANLVPDLVTKIACKYRLVTMSPIRSSIIVDNLDSIFRNFIGENFLDLKLTFSVVTRCFFLNDCLLAFSFSPGDTVTTVNFFFQFKYLY